MVDLSIKNNNDKVVVEYLLKPNDRIDNLTLGMLVNNRIEGVLPVIPVQIEHERYFRYDITGMVTLKKYLGEFVKKERLLKAFYEIALAIRESKEYMINWTSFSLGLKEIYINERTGKPGLICLPILSVINDGNICNFFKNILFTAQFDAEDSGEYVGKLITLLNPKTYTIEKFISELEDMLGVGHKVFDETEEEEDEDEHGQEGITDEMENGSEINVEEVSDCSKEKMETKQVSEETGDEAETVLEKTDDKAEADLKEIVEDESVIEVITDVAETAEEVADTEEKEESADIPETAAETADTVEIPEETDDTVEMAEETDDTVESEKSETAEVQSSEREPEKKEEHLARPFLIKVSDAQKILIDKDYFVIGKDKEKADYCIEGCPAIHEEHAFIVRHGKEYFLIDNNSNYTYMNRVLIQPEEEVYIPHGAHLGFADEDFEFRMHE